MVKYRAVDSGNNVPCTSVHVCVCERERLYSVRWFVVLKRSRESSEKGARGVQGEGGVWAGRKCKSVQGK